MERLYCRRPDTFISRRSVKADVTRHIVSIHSCPRTHHQDWFGPFCVTFKGLKGNAGLHSFSRAAHLPAISLKCCHSAGTNYSQAVSSYSWPRASQSISDQLGTFYLRGLCNVQVPGNVQVRNAKEELLTFFFFLTESPWQHCQ